MGLNRGTKFLIVIMYGFVSIDLFKIAEVVGDPLVLFVLPFLGL